MTPDLINAAFEFAGVAAATNNILALVRDRDVRGVSIASVAFFTVWGFWNIWYYPYLGQTWSSIAAVALVISNALWLALFWYYKRNAKERMPCRFLGD